MVIPHISPTCRPPQRDALAQNVKTPLVNTNVIVRDWEPVGETSRARPSRHRCRSTIT